MIALLAALVRISVPYLLAAVGGAWSERAGVITLALEGYLLVGAFAATAGAHLTGSGASGALLGAAAGGVLALLHAAICLGARADQVVSGVAINLLADGLTRFLLKVLFDSSSNSPRVEAWGQGEASLGSTLAQPLVVVAVGVALGSVYAMRHTTLGLRVRAVGESPEAAASLGVDPARVQLWAVLLGGLCAGLGGAWLAADQRQFVAGMSNGRGYMALAALILGGWRPSGAALAALLFAVAETVEVQVAAAGTALPEWLTQLLPYALTLAALAAGPWLRARSSGRRASRSPVSPAELADQSTPGSAPASSRARSAAPWLGGAPPKALGRPLGNRRGA